MAPKKDKIIHVSKPSIWYYLLALFFPLMFFLANNSGQLITDDWGKSIKTYVMNSLALFMFFGAPVLLWVLRRELRIYKDRIVIYRPAFNSLSTYYFTDLIHWNITDIYIPKAGWQVNLFLKFKGKSMTFHKIELTGFTVLTKILEENYLDKKQGSSEPAPLK